MTRQEFDIKVQSLISDPSFNQQFIDRVNHYVSHGGLDLENETSPKIALATAIYEIGVEFMKMKAIQSEAKNLIRL